MLGAKRRRFAIWSRQDIVICNCSGLNYKHVHCPCDTCGNAAVSTSVEYAHWKKVEALMSCKNPSDPPNLSETGKLITAPLDSCNHAIPVVMESGLESDDWDVSSSCSRSVTLSSSCVPPLLDSSTTSTESDNDTSNVDPVKMEITCAILKALNLVDQMRGSVADFEDVLQYSKEMFCRNDNELKELWPKNWRETQVVLKKCGYKDPRELFICLDESHLCHWDVLESPEALCRHCGKRGTIKYYYLGIGDKIQLWCSNKAMCKKMMAHWEERGHWLQGVGANFTLNEVWDGSRFNELKWFWNPDSEWMLPVKCQQCQNVISVDEVQAFQEENGNYVVSCDECGATWMHSPQYTKGDPRNIALIGHWDGWQPFGFPGTHSCGAIEVTIANMSKADRSSTDEVYVVGFVPSYQLPKARPCALDPFLHPLITDVEDFFIDGLEVEYARSFECLPAGMMNIRVLILLWTGDYPAQHEVGKFIKHGQLPCRRDKLKGTNPGGGSTYYYGENRFRARFPWEVRKLEEDLDTMKDIDAEDRKSVRANKSKSCGYSGLTILYRLNKLYGFDIFQDLVIDTMHNIPTNITATALKHLIHSEKIDAKLVEERLHSFPWTAELKDGRVPRGFDSRLAFWKAEELHKFAFPASELIFADLLDDTDYHMWQLVVRMNELVFNKRDAWSHEDVNLFENLAQRYVILLEENRGLSSCVVTAHNLIHISSDAKRFSHPDNYWCFSFERAVKRYVTTSCNFKNIECSYAKREARRELLKHLAEYTECHNVRPYKINLEKMAANSLNAAQHLKTTAGNSATHVNRCNKGILVGGFEKNDIPLTRQEIELIKTCVPRQDNADYISEVAYPFKSLLKPQQGGKNEGILYRSGEHILLDLENDQPVVVVDRFLSVLIDEQYQTFVEGEILQIKHDEDGNYSQFGNTGYVIVVKNDASPQKIIVPVTCILRKVILYPNPCKPDESVVIDFQRKTLPLSEHDVLVPLYPKEGDMVLINGTDPEPWLAKVITVDASHHIAKVLYYIKSGEREDSGMKINIYTQERNSRIAYDKVSWNSIIRLAAGEWNNATWERPLY